MHKTTGGFSERLRLLMRANHLTVKQFANAMDVSISAVMKWRSGDSPTVARLTKIAEYFGVTTGDLLANTGATRAEVERWRRAPIGSVPANVMKQFGLLKHAEKMIEFTKVPGWQQIVSEVARLVAADMMKKEKGGLGVDNVILKDNSQRVPDTVEIQDLIEAVRRKASGPGQKAELARFCKATPQQVSAWLSGTKEPGGKYTVKLASWAGWLTPK